MTTPDNATTRRSLLLRSGIVAGTYFLTDASHAAEAEPPGPLPPAPASTYTTGPHKVFRNKDITVFWEKPRCIHARYCVMGAPQAFVSEPGQDFVQPDKESLENMVQILRDCPSGALTYHRTDKGPQEPPPAVNKIRIYENGPLAFHAQMNIKGVGSVLRATLCRCGKSKNKPFCDSSHIEAQFAATGVPEQTNKTKMLKSRGGELAISLQKDGPYQVEGNLEICAGTGMTVARVTQATLCRCGHSQDKPFCDGSHLKAGFAADGVGA